MDNIIQPDSIPAETINVAGDVAGIIAAVAASDAADVATDAPSTNDSLDIDSYIKRFEDMDSIYAELLKINSNLTSADHDQARVSELVKMVTVQTKFIAQLIMQLKDMNNLFARE